MTNTAPLENDIGACVFDAYGTLFDVAASTSSCRDVLGEKTAPLAALWRTKQLEYTWLRSLMDEYVDFWHITSNSLEHAMEALDVSSDSLHARLMELYLSLSPYEEVKETLGTLKKAGIKTAILSNGSLSMLISAVRSAAIQELINDVISVDSVGIYKPHPSVYQLAVDRLNLSAERICFMSSNAWDAAGAANFGFKVVWVNRFSQTQEHIPGKPEREITTLSHLPAILGL